MLATIHFIFPSTAHRRTKLKFCPLFRTGVKLHLTLQEDHHHHHHHHQFTFYKSEFTQKPLDTECEERENQQDATIRCLLSTPFSTCFRHHYARMRALLASYNVVALGAWSLAPGDGVKEKRRRTGLHTTTVPHTCWAHLHNSFTFVDTKTRM